MNYFFTLKLDLIAYILFVVSLQHQQKTLNVYLVQTCRGDATFDSVLTL